MNEKKLWIFHWHYNLKFRSKGGSTTYPSIVDCFLLAQKRTGIIGLMDLLRNMELQFPRNYSGITFIIQDDLMGMAIYSDKDHFSRKIGRTIAFGRLKKSPIDLKQVTCFEDLVKKHLSKTNDEK